MLKALKQCFLQSSSHLFTVFIDSANEAEWLSDLHADSYLQEQFMGLGIAIEFTGLCKPSDEIVVTLSLFPTK